MSYKELKEFLKGVFPDNSGQIMDLALRAAGTSDIDSASDAKKRLFANYVLKEQMDFSPQKNRDIYERLIKVIGLPPTENIVEYTVLLKNIDKKDESIIISSFGNFWSQVEKGYTKYEIIINLYLEKGIQAEANGEDRQKVRAIVDSAVHGLKHDIMEAYLLLLDELYLRRLLKKKEFHCDKIFENLVNSSFDEHPDKYSKLLLTRFSTLLADVDASFIQLEKMLLVSIDDLANRKAAPDKAYIDSLKASISRVWKSLKEKGEEEKRYLVRFSEEVSSI